MACKLCLSEEPLRNSHIIPEWAYKPLYDKKHRYNVRSTAARRPRPMQQKGLNEPLLCQKCETHLSKYEKYAHCVVEGGVELTINRINNSIKVAGLDYAKFKLFGLSVLWRAGVAKQSMFSRVSLGGHEPILRAMIRRGDPGSVDQFGFILVGVSGEHGAQADWIDQPERGRLDGRWCYRFVFAGFIWIFFVSSCRQKEILRAHFLQEDGQLRIECTRFSELPFVREFGKRLYAMDRLRTPNR